jgi:tetratricopeptide (TPR) repeat protein
MGTYRAVIFAILVGVLPSATVAIAAEPDIAQRAQYLIRFKRYVDAAAVAAEALDADPSDLPAHQAYQRAWIWLGEEQLLVQQYRSWHEAEPDDEVARVALARVLWQQDRVGNREEVERLLSVPIEDETARFWALHRLFVSRATANPPGDADSIVKQLEPLAAHDESWAAIVAIDRAVLEPVEGTLAKDLERVARTRPWLLDEIAEVLWNGRAKGAKLDKVRATVVRRAIDAAASIDPLEVTSASIVFHLAGEQELELRADRRLVELDPAWEEVWKPFGRRLAAAIDRSDPEGSLEVIDQIEEGASTDREFAAVWSARAQMLAAMEKTDTALYAWMRAHELHPDEVAIMLRYARLASYRHMHQHEAVELLDHALSLVHAEDYAMASRVRIGGYEGWHDTHNKKLADLYYLKASLLRDVGELEQAAAACRMSLALNDDTVAHMLLGTLYTKLGQPDLAFEHRVLGFGSRAHSAWRPLEAAWEAHPYWHHEGAEGYFADRSAIFDQPSTGREPEAESGAGNQESHVLLGHPIPDRAHRPKGGNGNLGPGLT